MCIKQKKQKKNMPHDNGEYRAEIIKEYLTQELKTTYTPEYRSDIINKYAHEEIMDHIIQTFSQIKI
jgi:hypothetical protein